MTVTGRGEYPNYTFIYSTKGTSIFFQVNFFPGEVGSKLQPGFQKILSQDRTLVLVEWQLSVPWLHEKLVKSGLKVGI